MALAAAMLLAAAPAAFATHVADTSQDTAGAGTEECRPGAQDNELIEPWLPTDKEAYIDELVAAGRTDDEDLRKRVDATWEFCDKNRDGILCVMRTDPSPYYWTLLDNRPFPR